jgi:hypothetical protein
MDIIEQLKAERDKAARQVSALDRCNVESGVGTAQTVVHGHGKPRLTRHSAPSTLNNLT